MKYIYIKAEKEGGGFPVFPLVFVVALVLTVVGWAHTREVPEMIKVVDSSPVPMIEAPTIRWDEGEEIDPPKRHYVAVSHESISQVFESVGSPLAGKVPWLVEECQDRDLNPALVAAVMAKESGWGQSWYCQNHFNCFGWGYTDSGDQGYHYKSFEEATEEILDLYAQWYPCEDAYCMADRGYNLHEEWVYGVSEIMALFVR